MPTTPDAAPPGEPRVTLVTRAGCHLCGPVREVVEAVAGQTGCGWREVDVDADADLLAAYSDLVPVVLVDGRPHDYYRVDEARLRAAVSPPTTSRWRRLLRGGD